MDGVAELYFYILQDDVSRAGASAHRRFLPEIDKNKLRQMQASMKLMAKNR
jgi:hypothetical protein